MIEGSGSERPKNIQISWSGSGSGPATLLTTKSLATFLFKKRMPQCIFIVFDRLLYFCTYLLYFRLKIVGTRVDASDIFAIGTLMDDYLGLVSWSVRRPGIGQLISCAAWDWSADLLDCLGLVSWSVRRPGIGQLIFWAAWDWSADLFGCLGLVSWSA